MYEQFIWKLSENPSNLIWAS